MLNCQESLVLEEDSASGKSDIILKDLKHMLIPSVLSVRYKLSKKYDVKNPKSKYYNYQGLCDEACFLFVDELRVFNESFKTSFELRIFHGEQDHSPRIDPKYWANQHSWTGVSDGTTTIYVDITSQQFQWLYDDIPNYYISFTPPKWFYWNKKNPVFYWHSKNKRFALFIENIFQYGIWGNICKLIRKIHK